MTASATPPPALRRDPLALATLAVAALIRLAAPLDPNVDWLTTVARAVRDGARLGRDIVETNPPMAVWLQSPAVLLERLTGWPAETLQTWLVFLAGIAAAEHLARRLAALGAAGRFDRAVLLAVFLVLPLAAFAEREHVGLVLGVPILALTMRRADGWTAPVGEILVAGATAALAAMIKPQFALPTLALAAVLAVRRRSVAAFVLPEFLIAGGLTLVYAAVVVALVPDYVRDTLPAVLDVYRPVKLGVIGFATGLEAPAWLIAGAAVLMLCRNGRAHPALAPLAAASAGFFLGFLEQGRGWPYHAFPALALIAVALLHLAPGALAGGDPRRRVAAVAGVLACLMPLPNLGYFTWSPPDIVAAIRAARPRPTVAAIAMDLTPGHPITTDVGGRWVGTHSSRWLTVYAGLRKRMTSDPEVIARCDAWMAYDRAAANRDLADKRPDIVLVGTGDRDWHAWIAADPETARLMSRYRLLARPPISPSGANRFEAVEAWIRADLVTAAR